MAIPLEDLDGREGRVDDYDDERGDAASDLLRLFGQAKRFVTDPSADQFVGTDRRQTKDRLRSRLAESIFDDCLLFDERTVYALFKFFSAWRGAAYGHQSSTPDGDVALERAYQRVLDTLGPYATPVPQGSSTAS